VSIPWRFKQNQRVPGEQQRPCQLLVRLDLAEDECDQDDAAEVKECYQAVHQHNVEH